MTATKTFTGFIALAMLLILGQAALTLARVANSGVTFAVPRAEAAVPNWLDGRQTSIERGLPVSPHATKHAAEALDARRIYDMLLQGKCAAAAQFCNSDGKKLYLCFDPITGLLGGLFIKDGLIESGWGSRASYWAGKVRGADAPFKPDLCYQ